MSFGCAIPHLGSQFVGTVSPFVGTIAPLCEYVCPPFVGTMAVWPICGHCAQFVHNAPLLWAPCPICAQCPICGHRAPFVDMPYLSTPCPFVGTIAVLLICGHCAPFGHDTPFCGHCPICEQCPFCGHRAPFVDMPYLWAPCPFVGTHLWTP